VTILHDHAEFPAVLINVWTTRLDNVNGTSVYEFKQSSFRLVPEFCLVRALGLANLRGVDVSEPDLYSVMIDRIAIDHAIDPVEPTADSEVVAGYNGWRRWWVGHEIQAAQHSNEYGRKKEQGRLRHALRPPEPAAACKVGPGVCNASDRAGPRNIPVQERTPQQ
jgi:hypothetical protein